MNNIDETKEKKQYLQSVLYKAQFRQKLGLKYLLLSGFSISLLVALWFFEVDFLIAAWVYLGVMAIYAKWFFPYTKDKGHYSVFLIKLYCYIKRQTILKLRECNQ